MTTELPHVSRSVGRGTEYLQHNGLASGQRGLRRDRKMNAIDILEAVDARTRGGIQL